MALVAVAPTKKANGVESALDDWRISCGRKGNNRKLPSGKRGVRANYETIELGNALAASYKTDAHLVAYVLRDPAGAPLRRQPRINKNGRAYVESLGYSLTIESLFADVDNPGHVPWTPELFEEAEKLDRQLTTAGVYYSAHGRRIVQPLTRAVPIAHAEGTIAAWLRVLQRMGFHPDVGCQDWTRHYRLPNVRRDDHGRDAWIPSAPRLSTLHPIVAPPPEPLIDRPGRRRGVLTRPMGPTGPADDAPLAKALQIAGLLGRSLGAGKRAVLCPFRSAHTTEGVSSTVLFGASTTQPNGWLHCSHGHCQHYTQDDFIAALPAEAQAVIPETPLPEARVEPREYVTPELGRAKLEDAFRSAPDGLSLVVAGCGTGKSEAALVVAHERASTEYASKRAKGSRAPAHSKTAISVPTTKLAEDLVARARAKGTPTKRVFGVLSVVDDGGRPECRYHAQARSFGRGGLSIPWEFCQGRGREPCQYADTCKAYNGEDGPDNARLIVGPHAMLSQLSGTAGATGLLVIDEPPALLAHHVIRLPEISAARDQANAFEWRYWAALDVALEALARGLPAAPLERPDRLASFLAPLDPKLLDHAYQQTSETEAEEIAKAAFPDGHKGSTAPAVSHQGVSLAKASKTAARAIGAASRVLRLVYLGLTDPGTVRARVEERASERVLVVTTGDLQLRDAIAREGATVLADANGKIHLPVLTKVAGYEPRLTEVYVPDSAEVHRTLLRTRASRSAWLPFGRLTMTPSLTRSLRALADWARARSARRLAIVTYRPLELAIRASRGEDVEADWVGSAGQPESTYREIRAAFAQELDRIEATIDVGHFPLRGVDAWKHHDALATLGDPFPSLTDARHEATYLGLKDWEGRYRALAAAELEQAHGRLRTVHRTAPCSMLHIGSLVPSGWEHAKVSTRVDDGGRAVSFLTVDSARQAVREAGSVRAAAEQLGISKTYLYNVLSRRAA
jgi:hypothetical protein